MDKVQIISIVDYDNYGNRLQNYAITKILETKNFDVASDILIYSKKDWTINSNNFFKGLIKKIIPFDYWKNHSKLKLIISNNELRANNFKEFIKLYNVNNITINYIKNSKNLKNIINDERISYYIVGSDQVWNPNFYNHELSLLKFCDDKKKIALAPSIGFSKLSENYKKELKEWLPKFKCLSCREEQGSQMIREITGRECTTLIDPTLMLSSDEWDKVSKKPVFHNENDKYILLYFLGEMTKEYKDIINNISKRYNLKVIDIYDKNSKYYTCGPSEFIYMIKHCSIMLTDSFHGSVFSYIYNKPFRIFKRIDSIQSMNSRLENLINVLHLSNDIYINMDTFDIEHVLDDPIYDKTILDKEQKKFKDYLDKAFKE